MLNVKEYMEDVKLFSGDSKGSGGGAGKPGGTVGNEKPDNQNASTEEELLCIHQQPIVCVNFSISASEPPMIIIRNFVGKLMSWCKDHQVFLNKTGEREQPTCRKDLVEFVDLFQDEGHRVAAHQRHKLGRDGDEARR